MPKPTSVAIAQVAGFVTALATAALVPLLLLRLTDLMAARRNWNQVGIDAGESEVSVLELARTEFVVEFGVVLALPAVLLLLAFITAVGLQYRRRWARMVGALWSGVLLLPIAAWAAGCVVLVLTVAPPSQEFDLGPVDPFLLNAVAGTATLIADVLVFVVVLTRGARRWAPGRAALARSASAPLLAPSGAAAPFR